MAFKFVALFALVAVASAGLLPVQYSNHGDQYENHAPAQYDFQYSVHDEHTGDIKSQQESRQGDVVHGQYSLIEADGHSRRVVDYTADAHNGFNAQVRTEKLGHAQHSAPIALAHAPVAQVYQHSAPVAIAHHAAPAVHYQQAQVYQHSAPVAIAHHAAPAVHYQQHAAPVAIAHHTAPAVHYQQAQVYQHAAPIAIAHHAAPAVHYQQHAAPIAIAHHAAPAVHYQQAQVYQHAAPAVHYSGSVGHSSQSISQNHNDNHYNNYHH